MRVFTEAELNRITAKIQPIFDSVLNEYDFQKYPAREYTHFKSRFSSLSTSDSDIERALIWKWGHWGKQNYPQKQRNLIAEIQTLWPKFVASSSKDTSVSTFQWWQTQLNRRSRYITVAYITHLIHHNEPLPIIDQHNFRAMNSLIGLIDKSAAFKKKPSNWTDISSLKLFMATLHTAMPNRDFSELDRFLMMYGRNYASR